jgi:putative metallohydrolase (TIGR04338 family)
MSGIRDSQRSRVYKAEKAIWGAHMGEKFREVKDVERFIKKQMARKAITRRYPAATRKVAIHDGGGRRAACAWGTWKISLPIWARCELVIIHEMAHIVANRHYGERHIAGHGWQFCSVFLDLVRFIMGREAHDALKASFKKHKVRFTKPRERKPLTPEQRFALAARLAEARASKTS